jgi:predicted acetyltransferase
MRPSRHGQGHDAALLAAVLPIARSQGIDPVIMIRDDSDIAARDAIEACGGCASIRSA